MKEAIHKDTQEIGVLLQSLEAAMAVFWVRNLGSQDLRVGEVREFVRDRNALYPHKVGVAPFTH